MSVSRSDVSVTCQTAEREPGNPRGWTLRAWYASCYPPAVEDENNFAGLRKEEDMATSSATIAVNYGTNMFLSLVSDDPADTVGVSVKDVSLLPQTAADNQFQLRFQAGSGVRSVNGISVTSISSTSVSITTQSSGGVVTATCSYNGFQTPAPTVNFTLFYTKQTFEDVSEDPTIVYNPPSGVGEGLIVDAPVAAAEVRAC